MKKILLFILSFFLLFSFWYVSADIFEEKETDIPYCDTDDECGLEQWINEVKNSWIDWVVTEGLASDYLQNIVVYVLWFLAIVWVILIIYSWFRLLVSAWNEEQMTNSKKIILYVVIWIVIIFLAWPITNFIIDVVTQEPDIYDQDS